MMSAKLVFLVFYIANDKCYVLLMRKISARHKNQLLRLRHQSNQTMLN